MGNTLRRQQYGSNIHFLSVVYQCEMTQFLAILKIVLKYFTDQ